MRIADIYVWFIQQRLDFKLSERHKQIEVPLMAEERRSRHNAPSKNAGDVLMRLARRTSTDFEKPHSERA